MEPGSLVLHALRLKGLAGADAVARSCGLRAGKVDALLRDAASRELVVERRGVVSGWSLTDTGRAAHARLVAAEDPGAGGRRELAAAYADFLALNQELLETCTAWQLRDGKANDHVDSAYDARCVNRLRRVDMAVQPVCARLSGALARFARYGDRLGTARERVEAGEREWFTGPGIDSYHTVWFELHEDLLVTLGLERGRVAGAD